MAHYFETPEFAAALARLAPVWKVATGNDRLAEFLAVPAPATFDPSTLDWSRWMDTAGPIAWAMEADAARPIRAMNAEQTTALGIVAHAALVATWHSTPGAAWIAQAVRDLGWAERWLFWPYGAEGGFDATL